MRMSSMEMVALLMTQTQRHLAYLHHMNELNQLSCNILNAAGYNGSCLQAQLPVHSLEERQSKITQPRSKEWQDRLIAATSQGAVFQATGGMAINDDDMFIATERAWLQRELKAMEKMKTLHLAAKKRYDACHYESCWIWKAPISVHIRRFQSSYCLVDRQAMPFQDLTAWLKGSSLHQHEGPSSASIRVVDWR